jgi:hypothetical protein
MRKPAVALYSTNKTLEKSVSFWMRKIIYVILVALIAVSICYFSLINFSLTLSLFFNKVVLLSLFAFLGLLHLALSGSLLQLTSFKEKFLLCLQLFVIIAAAFFFFYDFRNLAHISLAIAASSAFVLPQVLSLSWESFIGISVGETKLWYTTKLSQGAAAFIYGMTLKIKVPVKASDRKKKVFASKAPLSMKLGEFFDHFIIIQNNKWRHKIEVSENEEQDFGWQFYEENLGGLMRRRLDPEMSLVENGVKENSTIVALRVYKPAPQLHSNEINLN